MTNIPAETTWTHGENIITVETGRVSLEGNLVVPASAGGVILFAHGSGSSRHSPRNRFVAKILQEGGFATLLIDLLTEEEEAIDQSTRHLRFNIPLLADRLVGAIDWLGQHPAIHGLSIGLFGASTGAAAALMAAAARPRAVGAVVSRGGRPDLAGAALPRVEAPTLLLVGGDDQAVIGLNALALERIRSEKQLHIVPGATHLFEEPGALEQVALHARDWFARHLPAGAIERSAGGAE